MYLNNASIRFGLIGVNAVHDTAHRIGKADVKLKSAFDLISTYIYFNFQLKLKMSQKFFFDQMPWLDGTADTVEVRVVLVTDRRLLDGEALNDALNTFYINYIKDKIAYKIFVFLTHS